MCLTRSIVVERDIVGLLAGLALLKPRFMDDLDCFLLRVLLLLGIVVGRLG